MALLLPSGAAHAATATGTTVNFDDLKPITEVRTVDGATFRAPARDRATVELGEIARAELTGPDR